MAKKTRKLKPKSAKVDLPKMSLDELMQIIKETPTRQGLTRKQGAVDAVKRHLKTFALHFEKVDDILNMLNDYEGIDKFAKSKDWSVNTLKSYYTSLQLGADVMQTKYPSLKEAYDEYTKVAIQNANISNEAIKENIIPEKFGDKLPKWTDITDLSSKFTTPATRDGVDRLIVAFYTLIPPRRLEYFTLFYLDKKPTKEPRVKPTGDEGVKDSDGIPWNYIFPDGDRYKMVLGDYKTDGKYGVYETTLPDDLCNIIKGYIKKQNIKNNDYLLVNSLKEPFGKTASMKVKSAFGKKYTEFMITINNIRHIFETSLHNLEFKVDDKFYNEMTTKEKEDLSVAVGHSIMKSEAYRQITPSSKAKNKRRKVVMEETPTQDKAETSREAEERGEFEDSDETDTPLPESQETIPETEVVEQVPQSDTLEDDKRKLIQTMTVYYELKIQKLKKKIEMLDKLI